MKRTTSIGLLLAGLGIVFLILSTLDFKRREEVFRVGSFTASATTARKVPELRYVGFGCLGVGVVLFGVGVFRRR